MVAVGRPRTRSNPDPMINDGRILIREGSDGISHYSYRGDVDYERHLADFNRRNNIPEDIIPPSSTEDGDYEIPAANVDRNSDSHPDDDENNSTNSNNNLTMEELELKAGSAYSKMFRYSEMDEGLAILYGQKGTLNTKAEAFVVFEFTDDEKRQILNKYLLEPYIPKQDKIKSDAIQIVEGLKRLGKKIDRHEIEAFQAMSDKFGDQNIDLNLLLDRHAIVTLDITFAASKEWLQLTDDDIADWFTTWNHQKLAKVMSVIWASKNVTGTTSLMEQIRKFDFELDTSKMMLGREGEQQKITELMDLFFEHPLKEYASAEWQEKASRILIKKIPTDNWQRTKLEASILPLNTVKKLIPLEKYSE